MSKIMGDMCMIGFPTEADHIVGFQELFVAMTSLGEKVTDVGNGRYIIKKQLCSQLKTPHRVLQETF